MTSLDLFSDKSDLYALARPKYPQALYDFLSSCIAEKNRVWDCATGNGQAAIALAEIFNEVQATDLSEQQIAHAALNENIIYSVQSAEHTNFPDNYFDLITVAQAIHWFDFEKFWPETLRVLKQGGVFAAWGYDWFKVSSPIDAAITESIMRVIELYWAKQNQLVWNAYKDIDFPFEKITTPPIAMTQRWNLAQVLNYIHSWSATRRCMQEQGMAFFDSAVKKIEAAWGDAHEIKEVSMNFHLYAGRKLVK
jgi:ubiquinone/menaquinone biosynthesis C-methylase UbiE